MLFREASDQLALLGLPLGGTEEWADRLYIEGKGGTLLFAEAELDQVQPCQTRRPQPCARRAVCSMCTQPAAVRPLRAATCTQPAAVRRVLPSLCQPTLRVPPARGHTRGCSRAEEAQKRVEVM